MSGKEILKLAMELTPEERLLIVEGLLKSVDQPDKKIEDIWFEEAEKRLNAYRNGDLKGIPLEEIFSDE